MLPSKPMISALIKAEEKITLPTSLSKETMIKYLITKDFWANLRVMFKDYFSGTKTPILTTDCGLEILNLYHQYYLKFYNLIWYGWEEISPELNLIFDIDLKNLRDLLQMVLSEDAENWLNGRAVETQTLYRAYKALEVHNEKALIKWMRRIEKQTGTNTIEKNTKLINLCVEIGLSSRNKFVKKQASEFRNSEDNRLDFALKVLRSKFT